MELKTLITDMEQRTRKLVFIAIGLITAVLLFSVLALPVIIRHQAEKQLLEITGRTTTISGVRFNPFGMTLTIKGLRFMEPDKSTPFIQFDRLRLSLSSMSIFRRAPIVDELLLEKPTLRLVRTAPNRYNFSDILDRLATKPKKETNTESRFSINNIRVSGGSMDFNDNAAPVPVSHTVRDMNFDIPFISNIPYLAEKYADPHFSAVVDGGKLSFSGKAKPLAKAVEASLNLKLEKLDLPHYQPYIPANLPIQLDKGALTLDLDLTYRIHKDKKPELLIKGLTRLDAFALKERSGAAIAGFRRFEAQAKEVELFSRQAAFERIALYDPVLRLSRDGKGRFNLQQLAPESAPPKKQKTAGKPQSAKETPPLRLSIAALALENGSINFTDSLPQNGFAINLSNISAKASNVSTIPGTTSEYTIAIHGDKGETLTASGTAAISPLAVTSDFSLSGLELQRGWPYLQQFLTSPVKGTLDLKGKAAYDPSGGLSLTGTSLVLQKLAAQYGDKDRTELSHLELANIAFSQKNNTLEMENITLGKGTVNLSRGTDGKISPLLLIKQSSPPPTAPAAEQPRDKTKEKPLSYLVKQISVQGLGISFKDKMMESEPLFTLHDIKLTTGNLTGPKFSSMPLAFSARYGKNAPIRIAGNITPQPFRYKGSLAFSRLPIRDFEDYVPDSVNLFFVAGTLDSSLKLDIALAADGKPTGSFSGKAGVRAFHVVDTVMEEDLLKWESLQLDDIAGKIEPFSLTIKQIALNGAYSRVAIRKDGTLNLQKLVTKQEAGDKGQEKQATAFKNTEHQAAQTQKGQIRIDALTIQDSAMAFSDDHLPNQFKTVFHNLGGRVSGLSSDMNTRATVDLRGSLENQSPLQISGTVNPLRDDLFVDLTISFKDIELSPATPYSGTYLGYAIDRGKLSLDLKYHIENKELVAENKVFVDQFTFGDSVASDKATKLPVRLGIALLKDRKGQINLDLPVSGRTDDPKFSIWGLVWKVVTNLFIKAATSPFSLLSSMMGSSEDLSSVVFAPGSSSLAQAEEKKLELLAKALADRPGLKVEISGFVDKARDPEGYRSELLLKKLRQEKYLELAKNRQAADGLQAEQLEIKPEESSRLLKAVYGKEKFPKPRNIIGMAKDLPDAEMKKLIMAHIVVDDKELQQLASQRAAAVQQHLINKGGMDAKRLFQKRDDPYKAPKQEKGVASRVELTPIAQ